MKSHIKFFLIYLLLIQSIFTVETDEISEIMPLKALCLRKVRENLESHSEDVEETKVKISRFLEENSSHEVSLQLKKSYTKQNINSLMHALVVSIDKSNELFDDFHFSYDSYNKYNHRYSYKSENKLKDIYYSSDNKFIVILESIQARVVDLQTGAVTHIIRHNREIDEVIIGSNNNIVVTISNKDRKIKILNLQTNKIKVISCPGDIWHWALGIDDRFLIYNYYNLPDTVSDKIKQKITTAITGETNEFSTTKIIDIETSEVSETINCSSINRIICSEDKKICAVYDYDNTVMLIDLENGRIFNSFRSCIDEDKHIRDCLISKNNQYLIVAYTGNSKKSLLEITEIETGNIIHSIRNDKEICSISTSPDNKYLIVCYKENEIIYVATIFNIQTGVVRIELEFPKYIARELTFSSDNKFAAIFTNKYEDSHHALVQCINLETCETHQIRHDANIVNVQFSNDNKYLVSSSKDGFAKVLNLETGNSYDIEHNSNTAINLWPDRLIQDFMVQSVQITLISADSRFLVTSSNHNIAHAKKKIRITELATGRMLHEIQDFSAVLAAEITSDSKYLITFSGKGNYKIIDIETGKVFLSFDYSNKACMYLSRVKLTPEHIVCRKTPNESVFVLNRKIDLLNSISSFQMLKIIKWLSQDINPNFYKSIDPNTLDSEATEVFYRLPEFIQNALKSKNNLRFPLHKRLSLNLAKLASKNNLLQPTTNKMSALTSTTLTSLLYLFAFKNTKQPLARSALSYCFIHFLTKLLLNYYKKSHHKSSYF